MMQIVGEKAFGTSPRIMKTISDWHMYPRVYLASECSSSLIAEISSWWLRSTRSIDSNHHLNLLCARQRWIKIHPRPRDRKRSGRFSFFMMSLTIQSSTDDSARCSHFVTSALSVPRRQPSVKARCISGSTLKGTQRADWLLNASQPASFPCWKRVSNLAISRRSRSAPLRPASAAPPPAAATATAATAAAATAAIGR